MGDPSSIFGGATAASSAGSDASNLFGDASLGDSLTGGTGDIFGGSSSADLSNLFADAGLGSNILGDSSGLGGVFNTATDPSGAAAASVSATPPADAAGTPSGSDPSGNIGGTGSGGAPQPNQAQPARPVTPTPQQSPLGQLAKLVKGAFGLGALPSAGGPTGFTALPAGAGAAEGAGLGAAAAPLAGAGFLLPFMTQPTQEATGVEAPRTLGRSPSGPPDPSQQPARPVTPTPQPAGAVDPTITAGGPGAGAGQPPAAAAQPAPAPAAAPDAPATPAAATPDLPTRKGPGTSEAAPEPPEGQGAPTDAMGGIGGILRDVLGLALANPTLLPMLAQAFMGGRGGGRGGIPPWAMHGMMPFMRGQGRGFGGFRGGFLRPGYYPRRQGGWGFHPGGYHPGWGQWVPGQAGNQPMPFAGGGGSSGGGGASGGWSQPIANAPTTDGSPPNGGQAGNAASQPDGATSPVDGVPANVLNEARQIALQTGGDPQAVANFMRQQGFPQHAGEWCGDFVAAVTHAAGMVPPPGSAMAGAWARFGTPRQGGPQQGDIAVIRGYDARTGSNYTHVTIVDRVNPDGTFVGLGGNQRGGQLTRSVFSTAGADFRVPPASAPATATAAAPAAPAATPPPTQPAPAQSDDFASAA